MGIEVRNGRTLVLGWGLACAAAQAKPLLSARTEFAPKNDRAYDVQMQLEGQGITKAEFDAVLDRVQAFYAPIIKKRGGTLSIQRKWNDSTVNASAQRILWYYVVNMYGGLARHPMMTPDGFMLVACHETGHHIGGAPKITGSWASNEGQSDYFGTLQCMKNVLAKDDNVAFLRGKQVHPIVKAACAHSYATEQEQALCERAALAGYVLGSVLGDLGGSGPVDFATPDKSIVGRTDDEHPAAQCRLDTYLAGALCNVSPTAALSDKDAKAGSCFHGDGRGFGTRPLCWFQPGSTATKPTLVDPRVYY